LSLFSGVEPARLYRGQKLFVDRYSALARPERNEEIARTVVGTDPDLIITLSGLSTFKSLIAINPYSSPIRLLVDS
jgi:hypothetical protein